MATNIYNLSTGQTGFQVPGQPAPAGWAFGSPGSFGNATVANPAPGSIGATQVPVKTGGATTTTTQPPTGTTQTPTTVPNQTGNPTGAQPGGANPDQSFTDSLGFLDPDNEDAYKDKIFSYYAGKSAADIQAIKDTAAAAEFKANTNIGKEQSAANLDAARRGMTGTDSSVMSSAAVTDQQQAIADAEAAKSTALSTVADNINKMVDTAFQEDQTSATNYIAQRKADLDNSLTGLVASGHSLVDLQKSNPTAYQKLLQYAGGDENGLNALFVAANSKTMMNSGQPLFTVNGASVYGQMTTNPDGSPNVKYTTVKNPPNLPSNFKFQSFSQAANGTVLYIAAPVDANGNVLLDPTKPNNGVISGSFGGSNIDGTSGSGPNTPTSVDQVNQSILSQTGLSLPQFNYLTQGTSALARLSASDRKQIMADTTNWLNKNGIDISTFQSEYKTYNDVLSKNIGRFNSTVIAENELKGTLTNLGTTISDADLGSISAQNIADIFAGKQTNNSVASKYSFQLSQLRNEVALYFAAAQGKPSGPDVIDNQDAADVITNGIAAGSVSGLTDAITQSTDKMKGVLQTSVNSAQEAVWNLFGVGSQFKPSTDSSSGTSSTPPAFTSWMSSQGIDPSTLSPDQLSQLQTAAGY